MITNTKKFKAIIVYSSDNAEEKEAIVKTFLESYQLDYILDVLIFSSTEEVELWKNTGYAVVIKEINYETFTLRQDTHKEYLLPNLVTYFRKSPYDLQDLFASLKELCVPKDKLCIKVLDNLQLVRKVVDKLISETNEVFFDFETTMSSVHLDSSYLICISFCDINNPDKVYVIYFNHESSPFLGRDKEVAEALKPLFSAGRVMSAHNLNFDRAWVEKKLGFLFEAEGHCTITMHHLVDIVSKHGLEYLSKTYLGIEEMKDALSQELARIKKERKIKGKIDYSAAPLDILTEYVAMDSYAGGVLYSLLLDKLQQENLYLLFKRYSVPCNDKTYEMHMKGQNWDLERCSFLRSVFSKYLKYVTEMAESMPELGEYEPTYFTVTKNLKATLRGIELGTDNIVNYPKTHLHIKVDKPYERYIPYTNVDHIYATKIVGGTVLLFYRKKYSLSSSKDMIEVLFDIFKLPVLVETDKGGKSTSEGALSAIDHALTNGEIDVSPEAYKFCKLLLLSRGLSKSLDTYINGFIKLIGSDGHLHSSFLLWGTKTGRASSSGPNMQNLSSEEDHLHLNAGIKTCLVPRHEGNVFIEVDFSALEYRIVAGLSNDEGMIKAFQEGKEDKTKADIHTHMASVIYNKDYINVSKEERKDSKSVNFGILYGSHKKTIADNLGKAMDQVDKIFNALFAKYPRLEQYIEKVKEEVLTTGSITNIFGMKYKMLSSEDVQRANQVITFERRTKTGKTYKVTEKAYISSRELWAKRVHTALRQSVNYTIQGPGGMVTVMCFTEIDEILKKLPYLAELDISVHDSILVECPIDRVKEVLEDVIAPVMTKDLPWMNGVPMAFDAKVGRTAGCMIAYEDFLESPESIDRKYDAYTEYYSDFENIKKLVEKAITIQ